MTYFSLMYKIIIANCATIVHEIAAPTCIAVLMIRIGKQQCQKINIFLEKCRICLATNVLSQLHYFLLNDCKMNYSVLYYSMLGFFTQFFNIPLLFRPFSTTLCSAFSLKMFKMVCIDIF